MTPRYSSSGETVFATQAIEREHEAGLVRGAAAGDRSAFASLYQRYARMIHGILISRVPWGDAEDLVQDVFLTALDRLASLRDEAAFGGWLCAIARHRATDHLRQCKRKTEPLGDVARTLPAPPEAFAVLDEIRSLPAAYRETLVLRLVEGMTGPEISRRTGLRPESVRVNLCRGMKMLRERLEGRKP